MTRGPGEDGEDLHLSTLCARAQARRHTSDRKAPSPSSPKPSLGPPGDGVMAALMLRCTRCGLEATFDAFRRDASQPSGYKRTCLACVSEQGRAHYANNAEAVKERARDARKREPEKHRAAVRAWREAHPDMVRAQRDRARDTRRGSSPDTPRTGNSNLDRPEAAGQSQGGCSVPGQLELLLDETEGE